MSDLPERLRRLYVQDGTNYVQEAADEIERLRQCLRWQEARDGRIGTHGPGCYAWGPSHYQCALAEVDTLRATLTEPTEVQIEATARRMCQMKADRLSLDVDYLWSQTGDSFLKEAHEVLRAALTAKEK